MGKLILCYVAALSLAFAWGVRAQDLPHLVKRSVRPGPPAHPNLAPLPEMPPPPPLANPALNAPSAGTGIVYTCDPGITALYAQLCTVLNTTIAGLYRTWFTNANATIYVKLGNVDLGESDSWSNYVTYSTFRGLITAAETDPNDVTAVTDSMPAVNIYGSYQVQLNTALQRALGYANPTDGVDKNDSSCNTNGSSGCYDGLITISSTQPLYFRTGTISSQQYDVFSVIQHETDEILGTSSCAFGNCSNVVDPADYFRYHSNGTRAWGAGSNTTPCTASGSTNACFSLDGVHMLQQYNNESGDDAGDWTTNCPVPRVQDDELCAGTSGVDISPTAEVIVLDTIGYTLRTPFIQVLSSANPATVWLAPGSLASAYGTGSDFATGPLGSTPLPLPTNFGGTSVSILDSSGAKTLAPLLYVNPTQVNFEVPLGVASGAAQVTITSGDGTQSVANVQIAAVAPGIFELNSAALAAAYVIVYHANGTQTYEQVYTVNNGAVVAAPVSLGSATDQAYLFLFGTGLQAAGTSGVTVSVNGRNLPVQYAGPQGGFAGEDQINVQLPTRSPARAIHRPGHRQRLRRQSGEPHHPVALRLGCAVTKSVAGVLAPLKCTPPAGRPLPSPCSARAY